MLSKIYHYKNIYENNINTANLKSILYSFLNKRFSSFSISPIETNGTLGYFFILKTDDKEYFIKTHKNGTIYRNALINEATIFSTIYKNSTYSENIEIDGQVFFIMERLYKLEKLPTIQEIKCIIDFYSSVLINFNNISINLYTFEELYNEGLYAIQELYSNGLVLNNTCNICLKKLRTLEPLYLNSNHIICHGDLSNKNIMLANSYPIAIDWEDCFIGFPNYDFCYWLTFLDQRKFYSADLFSNNGISNDEGTATMLLIVILKCYLSFISGSYLNNKLSFEERILEILNLSD